MFYSVYCCDADINTALAFCTHLLNILTFRVTYASASALKFNASGIVGGVIDTVTDVERVLWAAGVQYYLLSHISWRDSDLWSLRGMNFSWCVALLRWLA